MNWSYLICKTFSDNLHISHKFWLTTLINPQGDVFTIIKMKNKKTVMLKIGWFIKKKRINNFNDVILLHNIHKNDQLIWTHILNKEKDQSSMTYIILSHHLKKKKKDKWLSNWDILLFIFFHVKRSFRDD